ncbi:MAG: hypothetical protein KY466_10855 [Gemmatimonadetes bacterium]|nr:hypothetical protein [Gemmatimonadota bacterium]
MAAVRPLDAERRVVLKYRGALDCDCVDVRALLRGLAAEEATRRSPP